MNAMFPLFAAAAAPDKAANTLAAARALTPHLNRSRALDRKLVAATMTTSYGGSDTEGAWSWKDAYDAVEVALVLQVRRLAAQIGRLDAGPKGATVQFHNDKFPNPAGLVEFVTAEGGKARIKDNKLMLTRDWAKEADKIKGAFAIARDLAEKAGALVTKKSGR